MATVTATDAACRRLKPLAAFFHPALKRQGFQTYQEFSYDVNLLNDGFRSLVKGLQLDYLFIDTHPGLSKETFLSIAISHVLILILHPDKQDYQSTAITPDTAVADLIENAIENFALIHLWFAPSPWDSGGSRGRITAHSASVKSLL